MRDKAIKASYLSIASNAGLAIAKGLVGFFGNSYALIADAIESAGDVLSSIMVLFGLRYSTRPPDENHPYGHGKAETLVTFIVAGFLVVSAGVIAYQSIQNIQTPHEVPETYTLIFLGAVILTKEILFRNIRRKSQETNSSSLKADAWHHRSDAVTSLTAFIGILVAVIFGKGYETADDWAALFASGFILYNAYLILRPALGEIMDEHMYDELILDIRKIAAGTDGVMDTEKCYVRKSGMQYFVDLHITVNGQLTVSQGHDIAHQVKDNIMQEISGISDVLVHVEPDGL